MPSFIFIQNLNRAIENPPRIKFCDSFACRLRGLMFLDHLSPDDGLVLVISRDSRADSSIHMFFVPFDLAVFWINNDNEVVDKVIARSWRPAYFPARAARYTLEIHPERFNDYQIGDKVAFKDA
ncbi:MAG: DUF192 domain-containing protein [Chloroflexi bacterium]|nr:DUF192 domain-containing protein [Chloroflexota bacterium]